ncbi:MAG: protein kinase [Bifidobacteriaceae bacterium]|jgi:serine/threonine-protein kinase|nr:protein kinase [Bifidobacteriaceae bacterium]
MIAESGLELAEGRYRLVSRIAVGGMGEVWRAHNVLADEPIAIKVLRSEFTGDAISLKRLRIEARNASLLHHPNITRVLDYREIEGTGYLVMEYVDGQSLADVLAIHTTIAPLRLLPILIQASLGLHAAHSAGVVHRDVKPGNILLGPSDHVKLTDFGISVAHGQLALTDAGKVMGTAQYLAPEQALGNPATPAGDLYSLGVIAYEALVGHRPFRGSNYVAIALAQVNEQPPPLPGSVERSLASLVMRLLEKDPGARPADGAELAGLFGEVLETHRHLTGLLLATRQGGTSTRLLRAERGEDVPDTAEQAVVAADRELSVPVTTPAPVVQLSAVSEAATHPGLPADAAPLPAATANVGESAAGQAGHQVAAADHDSVHAGEDHGHQPPGGAAVDGQDNRPGRPAPEGAARAVSHRAARPVVPPRDASQRPVPHAPSRRRPQIAHDPHAPLASPVTHFESLPTAHEVVQRFPSPTAAPLAPLDTSNQTRPKGGIRDWIAPVLVAIGLIIIIVIGLITAINASESPSGQVAPDGSVFAATAQTAIIVSTTAPQTGASTEG